MSEPVFYPDGPPAKCVEITNGVQRGPARLTGQFGTKLDYSNAGRMIYFVDVVDVKGNRLNIHDDRSYERAIVAAEEAAADWQVPVDDLVAP